MDYTTSDLYLTSYLRIKNHSFEIKKDKKKVLFVFKKDKDLIQDLNDYLLGMGTCVPLSFTNSIKNTKSLIFNTE